jgi:hypothetical protein
MKKLNLNKHIKMNLQILSRSLVLNLMASCLVFITSAAFAQLTDAERNEQVTIVGSYDPTIDQAFKINLKPQAVTFTHQKPSFTFEVMDVRQDTKLEAGKISPATIRADRRKKMYDNYLRAGFGSLISPYLEFHHSSGDKNDSRFNARVYHLSSFGDIPGYAPGPFSNTDLDIGYDKYTGSSIFSLGIGYGLDMYRYYGFETEEYPEVNTSSDSLRQSFNQIRANMGLRSNNKKTESFEYDVNLNAYYYFDRWQTSQTDLQLGYDLGKPFESRNSSGQKAGIRGLVRFGVNKDSLQSNNDLLVSGIPYYRAKFGLVSFGLGVNLSYLMTDSSDVGFFPVIDIKVNIIEDILSVYAGADGGFVKNSYFDLSQENPWISSALPISWQKNNFRVFAGVRGNITGQLGFNLEAGWSSFEHMPFFVNTEDPANWSISAPALKFTAAFDDGNVFTGQAEINYRWQQLTLWLNGSYNVYSLDSLPEPFHKPLTVIGLGGSYLIKEKVRLWLEMFSYGKRHALDMRSDTPEGVELDGFLDLNAGIDFYATEKLTVFVRGTNLLNSNYQRFLYYPVQGLQVMGGIGYRF